MPAYKIFYKFNFSLDGAVNQNNFAYYRRIFKNLTNPNGCQVHGTFFLLHDYNNYHNIMDLRHDGHEMAVSSISDDKNLYLKNSTAWTDELAGYCPINLYLKSHSLYCEE